MAKYKIIPSSRTIVRSPIFIGHKAEKGVEAIEFDLTAWVETYGSGTLTVIMRRWGDAIPYPIALEIGEDNKATWTLSDIDTAKAGMAYAQLNYIVGNQVVKKSDIYTFRVMDSLTGEGEPPEAYESWLEHLTHLAAEAMAEVLDIEGIVTDKTLTVDGGIADAKAAGDALALKADKSTTYTKTEVDALIDEVEVKTDTTLSVSGAPADAAETGRQIGLLKADLGASVLDLITYADHTTRESAGITYTNTGKNTWTVNGTLNGTSFYPLFSSLSKTAPFVAGKNYKVWFASTSSNVYLQLYKYVGSTATLVGVIYSDAGFQSVSFPADATGVILRIRTSESVNNATVTAYIYEDNAVFSKLSLIDTDLSAKIGYVRALTYSDDLDAITDVGVYAYSNSDKPSNAPAEESNAVVTILHGFSNQGFLVQLCSTYTGKLFQRLRYTNGTWTTWYDLSSGDGETVIENTYNITTSPTITTDSNGWLQAVDTDTADETGKTDMTGAIMSMLNDTGYCHLGEGIFYVSGNIDMPEGSMLCGCGKNTVIRLLNSVTAGYCVKIGKYCTIKDISFEGARTFVVPSTKGTKNGVVFMADYDASPSVTTEHCMISNVWFRYFSGAGIYCYNTSINYGKGVYVTNAFMHACYAGIDIEYYSEFNKFVNVCTSWCKYGCINNAGNNTFESCTFHASDTGFYIDGTQPNNAHGTLSNCVIHHVGSNTGKAIDIRSATNGFVINACQIGYGSINVSASNGIVFSGCEFLHGTTGAGPTINIDGGNTVLFVGCMFMNDVNEQPDITITNNTKVKFVGCYGGTSGNPIAA